MRAVLAVALTPLRLCVRRRARRDRYRLGLWLREMALWNLAYQSDRGFTRFPVSSCLVLRSLISLSVGQMDQGNCGIAFGRRSFLEGSGPISDVPSAEH